MLNKVQFIGHLGRDCEVRYTPAGAAVANFAVASTEKWKDKSTGERMESTEWLRCAAFDKLAEICGEYLKKGTLVYVEGSLKTRKYNDKDGVEKSITECRVASMRMLGGGQQDGGEQRTSAPPPARRQAPAPAPRPAPKSSTGFDDMDDALPF